MIDSLELLSIIDIIKNEGTYTARLQELADAEQRITEAKYVGITMDQASKLREEADADRALAKEVLELARKTADSEAATYASNAAKLEAKYQQHCNECDMMVQEANRRVASVSSQEEENSIQQAHIAFMLGKQSERESMLVEREKALRERINKINQVMEGLSNG